MGLFKLLAHSAAGESERWKGLPSGWGTATFWKWELGRNGVTPALWNDLDDGDRQVFIDSLMIQAHARALLRTCLDFEIEERERNAARRSLRSLAKRKEVSAVLELEMIEENDRFILPKAHALAKQIKTLLATPRAEARELMRDNVKPSSIWCREKAERLRKDLRRTGLEEAAAKVERSDLNLLATEEAGRVAARIVARVYGLSADAVVRKAVRSRRK